MFQGKVGPWGFLQQSDILHLRTTAGPGDEPQFRPYKRHMPQARLRPSRPDSGQKEDGPRRPVTEENYALPSLSKENGSVIPPGER